MSLKVLKITNLASLKEINKRNIIITFQPMWQQSQTISQKFKVQIRRRQRHQIMKKQRQVLLQEQLKQSSIKSSIISLQKQSPTLNSNSKIKDFYDKVLKSNNYMEEASNFQIENMMALVLCEQELSTVQGATLLGSLIHYCGTVNTAKMQKVQIVRKAIQMSNIDEIIFRLIKNSIDKRQAVKIKLYLHCLKNMGLVRIKKILNKQLLQKNLMMIIDNFISEQSVLVFLAYISQYFPFCPRIMKSVCEQAINKQKIIKIMIVTIINNYIQLQNAQENIFTIFQSLIQTLIHLYISCKSYGNKYGEACLFAIIKLISKFPDNLPKELLKKIKKTKLQDTMIVMLAVSNEETKQIVFQLQETIVDKTIHELQHQFISYFGQQIIYQIAHGLEYTNTVIVTKSLKTMIKIFNYASQGFLKKIESECSLAYVLEDLCYSNNGFIAAMAEQVKKYLPNEEADQMIEQ